MTALVTTYRTRSEWLEARTHQVQASEIAALFPDPKNRWRGLSSWESPLSLSLVKRGVLPFEREYSREKQDELEWRRRQEPQIAQWFTDKIQPQLPDTVPAVLRAAAMRDPGDFAIMTPSDGFPWGATVDRLLVDGDGKPLAVVEIKTAHQYMADEWRDETPLPYVLQTHVQMGVAGVSHAFIVASIGGQAPRWAYVPLRRKMLAIIRKRVREFWATVEADVDPPADGSKPSSQALADRWPKDDGGAVKLGDDAVTMWDRRQRAHEGIKKLTLVKDTYTNRLKQQIGEHSYGAMPDGRVLDLRANKAGQRNLRESKLDASEIAY